ncbi:MAG: NAD(P)/FAD-dependent oxidoreductase [Hyphomicrobiaceae bacterium]
MNGVQGRGSAHRRDVAVIGTGIAGMSAAWLLAKSRSVTVYEAAHRIGGHSNTVEVMRDGQRFGVDTCFIVFNAPTYPNLVALFQHLGVATEASNMTFAVSLDGGAFEYAGGTFAGLVAQPANLVRKRFWSMLRQVLRFYAKAPRDLADMGDISLDDYLDREGFGASFRSDHLYPMAAAIWSTPAADVGDYPAAAFVRFCENHGLLKVTGRPIWRTVMGGSRAYVEKLTEPYRDRILTGTAVTEVRRMADGVYVRDASGGERRFDDVVIATHADQALAMLADPSEDERRLLGAFRYARNDAVLHTDISLMPKRRAAWSSWNYLSEGGSDDRRLSVTYWMNSLQRLATKTPVLVTLNPLRDPRPESVLRAETYHHPMFDLAAMQAQRQLWSLQGVRGTWYCGAHFGAGFHEDGLQSGLAVAEDLAGLRRPWTVENESGRIYHNAHAPSAGASRRTEAAA